MLFVQDINDCIMFNLQVQQMKAQNREEKMAKAQEREKLQREIAARERAERIQVRTILINNFRCIVIVSQKMGLGFEHLFQS